MVFKGRNCDVFNIDIYVNGDVAKVTSTDHIGHHISAVKNTNMIQVAEAQFWKSCNLFWLIWGTVIQLSKTICKQYCCSVYGSKLRM